MRPSRLIASLSLGVLGSGCAATAPRPMALRKVVLYQNGIGYFERGGHTTGGKLRLEFARPELDDVLKTLTVIDRLGSSVATVDIPKTAADARTIALDVRLSAGRAHDLRVSYAVPTPTWKAAYRVVLDDTPSAPALLQAWAMVNNVSQEDWNGVQLTLATGAPMSFATDLSTPAYVKRPDATGRLIAPTILGPIDGERATATDRDNDGILDSVDRCPDSLEDRDSFEDTDGCPELDTDHDKIVDKDDRCPTEPESYNGTEDSDGCPDRGRVVVSNTSITILESIQFGANTDQIAPSSLPIVEMTARTLIGNPDVALLEIGGHASSDEREAWGLSSRRAAAVRAALIRHGVDGRRLVLTPYGATQPRDPGDTERARATNRRIEFLILKRAGDDDEPSRSMPRTQVDVASVQASTRTRTKPSAVAGSVRYVVSEPITVRRGNATMISIINKPIGGQEVFLFRPDSNAPGSALHPFRALRLENTSGFSLEPGPIAIFARGTFVGDSLLQRLEVGETTWIPYAVDGGTQVTTTVANTEHPVRILSIQRGVLAVENAAVRTTKYAIAVGADPATTIYIRHDKAAGFTARDLPPRTIDRGDSYLIPVPIVAGKPSVLTVDEREPRERTIALVSARSTEVLAYVEGSSLPAGVADKLAAAIALRKDSGTLESELESLRSRITDVSGRAAELRESLKALDRVRGADDLRKKLLASLAMATADADTHARKMGVLTEAIATARQRLQDAVRDLTLSEP